MEIEAKLRRDKPPSPVPEEKETAGEEGGGGEEKESKTIDLIRNYGPGTRDGASGFDRAAGTVASCSFVVEEFDR